MKEYDFYVVKTEDGEVRIYKDFQQAKDLAEWYVKEFDEPPYEIKGHKYGDSI